MDVARLCCCGWVLGGDKELCRIMGGRCMVVVVAAAAAVPKGVGAVLFGLVIIILGG